MVILLLNLALQLDVLDELGLGNASPVFLLFVDTGQLSLEFNAVIVVDPLLFLQLPL